MEQASEEDRGQRKPDAWRADNNNNRINSLRQICTIIRAISLPNKVGVLKRNLKHCPRSIKDMAYKTILRPKLEYASAVWDPFTEDNIRKLEAVQRRAARFVCNSYRQTASVSSMLSELSWPLLEQRRAEARLGLFHRIVHKSVDIDAATLTTRSTRPTRKANEVQYTRHMTSKDCYKFSFIPRTIIQWNGIAATGDFNQYKSDLKSHDLTLSGPSYNYKARQLQECSLRRDAAYYYRYRYRL